MSSYYHYLLILVTCSFSLSLSPCKLCCQLSEGNSPPPASRPSAGEAEDLQTLERAVRSNPTADLLLRYAQRCVDAGTILSRRKAKEALDQCLALKPDDIEARLLRARLFERYARISAHDEYQRIVDMDPTCAEAWRRIAGYHEREFHEWSRSVNRIIVPFLDQTVDQLEYRFPEYRKRMEASKRQPGIAAHIYHSNEKRFVPLQQHAAEDLSAAIHAYENVVSLDPDDHESIVRLGLLLYEARQLDRATEILHAIEKRKTGSTDAYLLLGLCRHAMLDYSGALRAFEQASRRMTRQERDYLLFGSSLEILRPSAGSSLERMSRQDIEQLIEHHWSTADPLYLTDENEILSEHYARIAYAALRFRVPDLGIRGWDTDRGKTLLRFGRPEHRVLLRPEIEIGDVFQHRPKTEIWSYGDWSFGFVDSYNSGNYRFSSPKYHDGAQFEGASDDAFNAAVRMGIYRYAPTFSGPIFNAPFRMLRFRSREGNGDADIDVAMCYALPAPDTSDTLSAHTVGLFLLDNTGERTFSLKRDISTQDCQSLPRREIGGSISLMNSVEFFAAHDSGYASIEFIRHADSGVSVTRFPWQLEPLDAGFGISDIVLASDIREDASLPLHRGQYSVAPIPDHRITINERPYLYVEIYDLLPDDEGAATFELSVSLRPRETGSGFSAAIRSVMGFLGIGSDEAILSVGSEYTTVARDLPITMQLDVRGFGAGDYIMDVSVHDKVRNETAERSVPVHLTEQ